MEAKLENIRESYRLFREKPAFRKLSRTMMLFCCMLPIAAILLLPRMGVALGNGAWIAIVLLCPVSHFLMMRVMRGSGSKGGSCHGTSDHTEKKITRR